MNFLVFSDSHGKTAAMASLIRQHIASIDAVIHLGDGAADVLYLRSIFPSLNIYAVLGNCDPFSYTEYEIPPYHMLNIGDKMIFCCHGNRLGVSEGISGLIAEAVHRDADIVLFGHTHAVFEKYFPVGDNSVSSDKPRWVFNPGSISKPRDGVCSFALLHVSEKGVLFSSARIGGTL